MNEFTVDVPAGRLDLPLTATSGQVFRWNALADGTWFGVDGPRWFRVWLPDGQGEQAWSRFTGGNRDTSRDALQGVSEARRLHAREGTDRFRIRSNGAEADFRRLFRLDWDADVVAAEIIRRGPELEPYVAAMSGLRLMRPSDSVEIFFSFVCSANNNLPRITSMVRQLASYGRPSSTEEGMVVHRFPSIDVLASLAPEELRARAFGYRAENVVRIAGELRARGGEAYLESLKAAPYAQVHEELIQLKGIGKKLADCIALFALHHTDAFPLDTHTWQAVTRLYFPHWQGTGLTDRKYEAASAFFRSRFRELTGWAQSCLFYDNVLNWRSRR